MIFFLSFDTIQARGRPTDGRTDGHVAVAKTCASLASRGEKLIYEFRTRLRTMDFSYALLGKPWIIQFFKLQTQCSHTSCVAVTYI